MKAITSEEIKQLEGFAVRSGITTRVLMEIAGMKVAGIAIHEIKRSRSAVVVCGKGGNGGDGLVCARYLHNSGLTVSVHLTNNRSEITNLDAKENLMILERLAIPIHDKIDLIHLKNDLLEADIVIDAIFGIGHKNSQDELSDKFIQAINITRSEVKDKRTYSIISVDVPSGIDATTGEAAPATVEADVTVTFEYMKIGLLKYPASKYSGKVIITTIGIPRPNPIDTVSLNPNELMQTKVVEGVQVTDSRSAAAMMPKIRAGSHKGDRGKILLIAGSSGMMGAGILASRAAMRTGSGLVKLSVPSSIKNAVNTLTPEVLVTSYSDITKDIEWANVLVAGPGISTGTSAKNIMSKILSNKKKKMPVILDADALNLIKDIKALKRISSQIIITPHTAEFSRLTKISVEDIEKDRIGTASNFARTSGTIVVLKGQMTVIASPDGRIYVNPTGNPGMATAGAGDVLCGIIASLVGQGSSLLNAAVAGTYIHGLSGDLAASIKGMYGMISSDIIDSIPFSIASIL